MSPLRSKNYFQVTIYFQVPLTLVLKSSEALPKYGKMQINSVLGTLKLRSL